jgi:hypothetical protein
MEIKGRENDGVNLSNLSENMFSLIDFHYITVEH